MSGQVSKSGSTERVKSRRNSKVYIVWIRIQLAFYLSIGEQRVYIDNPKWIHQPQYSLVSIRGNAYNNGVLVPSYQELRTIIQFPLRRSPAIDTDLHTPYTI